MVIMRNNKNINPTATELHKDARKKRVMCVVYYPQSLVLKGSFNGEYVIIPYLRLFIKL
jgi:hypothetical protein